MLRGINIGLDTKFYENLLLETPADRVRATRHRFGIDQQVLSAQCGVPNYVLSRFEKGILDEVPEEVFTTLAEMTGVDKNWIMNGRVEEEVIDDRTE